MELLTAEEISRIFNDKNTVFWKFRDLWDGWRYRKNNQWGFVSILQELKKDFPTTPYVKDGKPLRSFKRYSKSEGIATREKIYSDWVGYLNEEVINIKGERTTIFKESIKHARRKAEEEGLYYTDQQLVVAFSSMLWRTAEGVRLEVKTVRMMQEMFASEKVHVEFSGDEDEDSGSDFYFFNPVNEHRIDVSVKCLGGVTPKNAGYLIKKDSTTLFICGFKNSYDTKLTFYIPKSRINHKIFKTTVKLDELENVIIV